MYVQGFLADFWLRDLCNVPARLTDCNIFYSELILCFEKFKYISTVVKQVLDANATPLL